MRQRFLIEDLLRPFAHDYRLLLVSGILLATGCTGRLATYPVQGKVQFPDGSPVRVGTVELKSLEHAVQARGAIQADGSFSLTTFEEQDGAVAGKHACVVVQLVMTEDVKGHRASKLGVIDRRYSSYSTSGLTLEVLPQADNQLVIKVEGLLKEQPTGEHKH